MQTPNILEVRSDYRFYVSEILLFQLISWFLYLNHPIIADVVEVERPIILKLIKSSKCNMKGTVHENQKILPNSLCFIHLPKSQNFNRTISDPKFEIFTSRFAGCKKVHSMDFPKFWTTLESSCNSSANQKSTESNE